LGEILLDAVLELFVLLERLLGDAVLAQVVPNELIGVEIRCIARQEVQLEPTLERLHIGGDNLGAMRREFCGANGRKTINAAL
jgi:hypothetical protein